MSNLESEMSVAGLPIPKRLADLIQQGLWPRTKAEELMQNSKPLVPKERIHLFAPDEDKIYFVRPPFSTVDERSRGGEQTFWSTFAAAEDISPKLSVFIGSFGLGSDSPIVLDYRRDGVNPPVIRLKWRKAVGLPNVWIRCADSFDEFADMLGLDAS
jgi:hypothetical protein